MAAKNPFARWFYEVKGYVQDRREYIAITYVEARSKLDAEEKGLHEFNTSIRHEVCEMARARMLHQTIPVNQVRIQMDLINRVRRRMRKGATRLWASV